MLQRHSIQEYDNMKKKASIELSAREILILVIAIVILAAVVGLAVVKLGLVKNALDFLSGQGKAIASS